MKNSQKLYRSIYIEERFEKDGKNFGRGMIIARPATGEDFSRACEALSGDDEQVIEALKEFGCVSLKKVSVKTASNEKVVWREEWLETRQSLDYGRGLKRYSGEVYEII